MFSIEYSVYLFLIAATLAFLEIQIEGAHGWAEKLPCWRPDPNSFITKSYARMMGGKPLTGYHIAIFSLGLIILHFPFSAGISWTLVRELEAFSAYCLLMVCEDFLWFVWNPHYGLRKFNPQAISWHKNWIGLIPTDYLKGVGISLLLAVVATLIGGMELLVSWGVAFGILTGLTLLSLIFHLLKKCQA